MKHALLLFCVMTFDHWLANTERVAASSILGLIFNGVESTLVAVKKIFSRR